MDSIKADVANAESQERFLSDAEIESAFSKFQRAAYALEAAKRLTQHSDRLSESAAQVVYAKFPQYALTSDHKAKVIQDTIYFLRIISYCLVVGEPGPLEDYFLEGLNEMYESQELNLDCAIAAVEYIRFNHGLDGDCAAEAEIYLDYLLNALQEAALSLNELPTTETLADTDPPLSEQAVATIALLQSWLDDEEDEDDQRETGEFLIQALDEDRLSERKLFPAEMKGVSW